MQELPLDSSELDIINIRMVQLSLQEQIEDLRKKVSDENFVEVSEICDKVTEKILNQEYRTNFSKTQNYSIRIDIASELFVSICSLQNHIVDFDFTKIVNYLLDSENINRIARKIRRKKLLEMKREKYFAKQAKSKILEFPENENDVEAIVRQEEKDYQTPHQEIQDKQPETNGVLDLLPASSDQTVQAHGNLTEIRGDITAEISKIPTHNGILREDPPLPSTQLEMSIREPTAQDRTEQDINEILQVLDDQAVRDVAEITQPEGLVEPREENVVVEEEEAAPIERLHEVVNGQVGATEVYDDWSLLTVTEEKTRKKAVHLLTDKRTFIPNYAERAMKLNRNIKIQRVQVFDGPPKVLQALSVEYLMKTTGFKSSVFQDKRNGRLNLLYSRHLLVEKRIPETLNIRQERIVPELLRAANTLPLQANIATAEYVGLRTGMHSLLHRRGDLSEIVPEPIQVEEQVSGILNRHPLKGIDTSSIMQELLAPPDVSKMVEAFPRPSTPRVQQLQGKKPEARTSPPWFYTTKKNPPNPKWREFQLVRRRLEEYWRLFEMQGKEKSISAHEFLALEGDYSVENYLTVLRIVDKLSIQRKVFLQHTTKGIYVKPFEVPYVSQKQYLLREKEPIF